MNFRLSVLATILFITFAAVYPFQLSAGTHHQSSQTFLNRTRRYLVFTGGGTFKYVFGLSLPLNFMRKRPYRQLTLSYSIHVQYGLSANPMYWWSLFTNNSAWAPSDSAFNPARSMNRKKSYDHNPHLRHYGTCVQKNYKQPAIIYDYSRSFVYKALEVVLSGKGLPGGRCVLRAICEVAQRPTMGCNFIGKLFNAIFRPAVANIDSKYLRAKKLGLKGTDCGKVYWGCNKITKWLKQLEYYF